MAGASAPHAGRTYGGFLEGRSEVPFVLKELKTGEARESMDSFFTCEAQTAVFYKSDRRICWPPRTSRNSDADPVFYLKTREGELIPPKVRGNPSGNPMELYSVKLKLVNL